MPLTHTMADRWLRRRLLELRDAHGLSQEEAAKRTGISPRTLIRIENSRTSIDPDILDDLLDIYDVKPAEQAELQRLRKTSIKVGWWNEYADIIPPRYAEHCELEEQADEILAWSTGLIYGLLQTERYAAMLHSKALQRHTSEVVVRFTELRMERQRRMLRQDRPCRILVEEMDLLRGRSIDAKMMREQVRHLKRLNDDGLAEIRVMRMTEPILVTGVVSYFRIGTRQVVCQDGWVGEEHTDTEEIAESVAQRFEFWWQHHSTPIGEIVK